MISPKPERVMDPEFLARYKQALAQLSRPESSATLLYEPHLITNNKKTTPKKTTSHKLLSNVKTLTTSGMLDGVAVRYVSKTKKIELPGKIHGPCYLCGCQSCNYSKTINAYEFENHAGCKTSHPNNHIHFHNGNTMHTVVMELNKTPETSLFDAIHTLTGSSIDHKAFSTWKGIISSSGINSSHELQPIFEKE